MSVQKDLKNNIHKRLEAMALHVSHGKKAHCVLLMMNYTQFLKGFTRCMRS